MGSYPSATLLYGVDLGIEEESEYGWYTDEMEAEHGGPGDVLEHLLKEVQGVNYDSYGNFNTGYTGYALCTRAVHARAYTPRRVALSEITSTVDDDAALRAAWKVLHPDPYADEMPEPGWFIVVEYD